MFKASKQRFSMRNVKIYAQIQKDWVFVIILVGKFLILERFRRCTFEVEDIVYL